MEFKSSAYLFSVIKQDLSSYDANNLIDEGTFYRDVKHIINQLGYYVYDRTNAVIKVGSNFKAALPNDFTYLDSAFKCSLCGSSSDTWNPQLGYVIRQDTTSQCIKECDQCDFTCSGDKELNKITVRNYVKGIPSTYNFIQPTLLALGNVMKDKDKCTASCPNLFVESPYFISLDNGFIYTNFKEDYIYLNYYAFPLDENGLPMIPNDTEVELAIEYYIKMKLFENLWINGDDPNVEKKVMYYTQKFDEAFKSALYKAKLPTFGTSVQMMRRNRRKYNLYDMTKTNIWVGLPLR